MKKVTIIAITLMLAIFSYAKDGEVIMVKPFTQNQRSLLPDKTNEFQIQNISFKKDGPESKFIGNVATLLQQVVSDDYEHYVFQLLLFKDQEGKAKISISDYDPMEESQEGRKFMLGVMKIGHCYFIVKKMANNEQFEKMLYTKEKGKTKFVREFELVPVINKKSITSISGFFTDQLNIEELMIAGEDKLNSNGEAIQGPLDYK